MKKNNANRYYLHRKLKALGIVCKSRIKTIFIGFDEDVNSDMERLRDVYNYSIQTEIL